MEKKNPKTNKSHTHSEKINPQTHTHTQSKRFPMPSHLPQHICFPFFLSFLLSLVVPATSPSRRSNARLLMGRHKYTMGRAFFGQSEMGEPLPQALNMQTPAALSSY